MSLTAKDLRAEAARLREQAEYLEKAAQLQEQGGSGNDEGMTSAQAMRKGAANARARAKHPIACAIVDSKWRSITRYAAGRLRVSQPALSRYISGDLTAPVEVMDKVRADFGLGDDAWPNPEKRL